MIKFKEDEMDRACSMKWGEEECIQDFGGKPIQKDTNMQTYM
jgi:hypothetical protein